jgi:hypothetical protein
MEAAEIPVKSSKRRICLENIEKAGVMEVECAVDGAGKSSFELICGRIILTYSLADGARLDVTTRAVEKAAVVGRSARRL